MTTRGREMAVRAALGAGRARLARLMLVETLVLVWCGAAAGVLIAVPSVAALAAMLQRIPIPIPGTVAVNMRVLLFTLGVSAVIALLLGALPALRAFRRDVQSPLKADGAATMGPGRLRIQRVLVGVQVALAVLLLTGAGLVVRSFLQLQRVSPGFDMKQILTMRLTLPQHRYPGDRSGAFFIDLIARLERLPGVTSAAAASQLPPAAFLRTQFQIDGAEPAVQDTLPSALLTVASRTYFQTLRIPLVRGRWFDGDRQGSPPVALVNDVAARRFFGGADALGRRFRTERDGLWIEIVGVVAAVRNRGL
jgi:predicted lysophospholipase L1 biosynthesis ABC-type transport system permease subunit